MPFNRDQALQFLNTISQRISAADNTVFKSKVLARLEAGEAEYGDASFQGDLIETIAEMEEEFLDIAGWGFVGWCKLQKFRRNWLADQSSSSSAGGAGSSSPND